MVKIAVIGSCSIDLTVEADKRPTAGETIIGSQLIVSPGGKGANQAVAAARLGAQVHMIGCVGDDTYGTMIINNLQANNIDTSYVSILPGQNSGTAHITLAEGDNSIIVIKGANDLVMPEHIDAAWEVIAAADLVMLQHEIPLPTIDYI
ncbi:MAG: PfkB family carbohydrate kinase, partial [Acidaminococcaceae bacterium]|nr:PfkB family carbohydrate kinase [Acidaminococcaceae bacterium]